MSEKDKKETIKKVFSSQVITVIAVIAIYVIGRLLGLGHENATTLVFLVPLIILIVTTFTSIFFVASTVNTNTFTLTGVIAFTAILSVISATANFAVALIIVPTIFLVTFVLIAITLFNRIFSKSIRKQNVLIRYLIEFCIIFSALQWILPMIIR